MPAFEYQVKDKDGKTKAGFQEAADVASLVANLRGQGFIIIRINEVKKSKMMSVSKGGASKKKGGKGGKVKLDDLVIFTRQMATLIGAGIPLVQALDILADQVEKDKLKAVLRDMHTQIQGGKSFSDSMESHKKVFSELIINMTRAGETSGSLEEILDRIATYLEKTSNLQKKVKSALMYPISVTVMAFLITFFMMAVVIPKFAVIFLGLNAALPAPTVALIAVSNFCATYWYLIIGSVVGGIFAFKQITRLPAGALAWDSFQLKMPLFGPLLLKVAVSKFSRTLATLIRSGVPILASLEIVARTSGNRRLEVVITSLMDSVKKGESISGPLSRSGVFPSMVVRMIAIGEETGELEDMLTKIADFYESEVDTAVDGLTSLIEPLVIAFLGIVVGGIVVALFLPILTLSSAVK